MEKIIEQKTFLGYVNNDTQIGTSAYSLVEGSKNTLIVGNDPQNYSVETRNGHVLFGNTINSNPITSSYDRFANTIGTVIPIRGTNENIQVWYSGKWWNLPISDSSKHEKYFTEWWDDVKKQNVLLWVGGGSISGFDQNAVKYWYGEIGAITGMTSNSITIDNDIIRAGFNSPSGNIISLGSTTNYNYTGVSGNTFTGVTPDPTLDETIGNVFIRTTNSTGSIFDGCNALPNDLPIDITSTFKNHVFYGSYGQKNVYVSNSFYTYDSTPDIISSSFQFNDIQISGTLNLTCDVLPSGSFNKKKIKIEIESVAGETKITNTGLTTILWNISQHSSNTRDSYQVNIVNTSPLEFQMYYNNALYGPVTPVITGTQFLMPNNISFEFTTDNTTFFSIDTNSRLDIGANDSYSWYEDTGNGYVLMGSGINTATPLVVDGLTYKFGVTKGHRIGEIIEYEYYPDYAATMSLDVKPFANFYSTKPQRRPGEGAILTLDSAPIAFIVQEDAMYINGQGGEWYEVVFNLSDDARYESIIVKRLKSAKANKIMRMANICHTRNDVVFVSTDKNIESIGRVVSVDTLPQTVPLSDPIKKDVKRAAWFVNENGLLNGHCINYDDKTFFTDPANATIYIYDHLKGFWQPPVVGIPVARFAIIDGKLCGHSSIKGETYQLFSGTNDNGSIIEASVRLSYNNYGMYSEKKNVQILFTAGFKNSRSNLNTEILFGFNGCEGRVVERIDPIMCISRDDVSIGQANLASHGHANKKQGDYDWFEHMTRFSPHSDFYTVSIGYFDNSMDGYFRIICTGLDASTKNSINSQAISQKAKTQEPPDIVGVPNNFGKSNYINQPDYVDTIFFGTVQQNGPWTGGSDGGGVPGDGDPL